MLSRQVAANAVCVVLLLIYSSRVVTFFICRLDLVVSSHWGICIIQHRGSIVLMEKGAFKHDHDALIHIHRGLLDCLEEPNLSSLERK